ncbi:diguanylate cyclase [Paraburkholderia sp. J67]|uniref:sensor domain-containing diguanylate cyclase n=1 Tax=Paraburkholderia sp. J67 TaxID=2805435 RepID=UPI002ABDDDCF|nr:diguanylate cyclase [Paraburkholderia sp. J67]
MAQREGTGRDATAINLPIYAARFTKGIRHNINLLGHSVVSPNGILCCSLILWLATISMGAATLVTSRVDAFNHAVQNSRNLTLVLERDIQRNIDLYDLSLRAVAEGAADTRVMSLPVNERNLILFDRAATARYLGSISVRDRDGRLLADSALHPTDRDDPTVSATAPGDRQRTPGGLYIGRPTSYPSGSSPPAIRLARVIYSPDGSVLGHVVGSLSLDYFNALTDGLSIGENGSVVVAETDGTLIARLPESSATIGKNFADTPVFQRLSADTEGYFVGTARLDGVRRLYVYKRLPGLPLIVAVAPALSSVYAEWWSRVEWIGALILVITMIKAAGTWLFVRELRRRQRAEAALERMAHRDSLTGLENRATFDEVLQMEWKRALRDGVPLSLLFIDIDRFKAYNDHYGHQPGDIALKAVAKQISGCIDRPGDHVARYGGEEFVVVLPDTDPAGAILIAERIRAAVFDLQIAHSRTATGVLTVSVGVSSTAIATSTCAANLVQTADAALYEAKGLGRNRVCVVQQHEAAQNS